jgi:hypothetical protein
VQDNVRYRTGAEMGGQEDRSVELVKKQKMRRARLQVQQHPLCPSSNPQPLLARPSPPFDRKESRVQPSRPRRILKVSRPGRASRPPILTLYQNNKSIEELGKPFRLRGWEYDMENAPPSSYPWNASDQNCAFLDSHLLKGVLWQEIKGKGRAENLCLRIP